MDQITLAINGLDRTVLAPCLIITLLFVFVYRSHYQGSTASKFPRIGKNPHGILGPFAARTEFLHRGRELVHEGYEKYKNSIFIIQTSDMERLVIPPKYFHELRSYPSSVLNIREAIKAKHLAKWNTLDSINQSNLHVDVTRVQLNQHLDQLVPQIVEEAELAWSQELAQCTRTPGGWENLPANKLSFNVVAQMVNRVLVGVPACRNKEWFQISLAYAKDTFEISGALRPWPEAFRYLIFPFLSSRKQLQKTIARAHDILAPEIELRRQSKGDSLDYLQWMVDGAKGKDRDSIALVNKVLFMTMASIVTSSNNITHAIYDLCAHPEIIEPLRDEVERALKRHGGWNLEALQKMGRLDSFLKESQRLNHGLFVFNRKVLKDIVLSDGAKIPAGSHISLPTYGVARDPDNYTDPLQFDPLRFWRPCDENTSDINDNLLTSVTSRSLPFGWGAFACPGRHFVSCQMKAALAVLLLKYRLEFPDGQVHRPHNLYKDERVWPNLVQQVAFQSRLM